MIQQAQGEFNETRIAEGAGLVSGHACALAYLSTGATQSAYASTLATLTVQRLIVTITGLCVQNG
jgi:hypothetical protein